MKKILWFVLALCAAQAFAEIKEQTIEYKDGDAVMEGVLVFDDASGATRPGIVIFHQWAGPTEHEKNSARKLAEMGYIAFVADIYGKGVRPEAVPDRIAQVTKYKSDRALMRTRANAALDTLKQQPGVDGARTVAIGYCLGGTVSLELGRSGADLAGIVSFHGGLDTPNPDDGKNIKARILVLHGADDPYVKPEEVAAFENEMRTAGVDWQLTKYSGAVHAFTQVEAGNDNSAGAAYNEKAAKRSWTSFQSFLKELFP